MSNELPKRGRGGPRPGSGAPKSANPKIAFSVRVDPKLMLKMVEVLEENPNLTRTDLVTKALASYLAQFPPASHPECSSPVAGSPPSCL